MKSPFIIALVLTIFTESFVVVHARAEGLDPADCISFVEDGQYAYNSCNLKVNFSWYDQGYCSTGCAGTVSSGQKMTVTKIKGRVSVAACIYPQLVHYTWHGVGKYSCDD